MKQLPHVSTRTAWGRRDGGVGGTYGGETEMPRADLMALENARVDQVFSKALSLFAKGRGPAGRLALATTGTAGPFRGRIVAGDASRREPVSRYAATASYAGSLSVVRLSQGRGVSVIRRASAARQPRPTDTFATAPRSAVAPAA